MYVHSNQFLRYRILGDWAPVISPQRRRFIRGEGDVLNGLQLQEISYGEESTEARVGWEFVVPGSFFTIIIQTLGTDCLNIVKQKRTECYPSQFLCFESVCQLYTGMTVLHFWLTTSSVRHIPTHATIVGK